MSVENQILDQLIKLNVNVENLSRQLLVQGRTGGSPGAPGASVGAGNGLVGAGTGGNDIAAQVQAQIAKARQDADRIAQQTRGTMSSIPPIDI